MDEVGGWPIHGIGHNNPPVVEVEPPKTYPVVYPCQPETEEPEAFRLRRNNEIETWRNLKVNAVQAAEAENDMRARVKSTLFPAPKKGTQRYALGGGYNIKLIHVLNYKLGNKDAVDADEKAITIRDQVEKLEREILAAHPIDGARIVNRLITWEPKLSGSEFEKLDDNDPVESDIARRISEILTVTPGSPQLTFEEPKPKKA